MAQLLIERWQLAVLEVRLELGVRAPRVLAELTARPDGVVQTLDRWTFPLEALGILDGRQTPVALSVPDKLGPDVLDALGQLGNAEPALWLRLVPPYGYLGAVPWEESVGRSGLPMLRVPDRLPAAVDPGRRFTMVVAVCVPTGSSWILPYLQNLLIRLQNLVSGELDFHVFADAESADRIGLDLGPGAQVHHPSDARTAWASRTARSPGERRGSSESPTGQVWSDWIADGLAGRAARAVHVVTDCVWDGDRPVLAVTRDPRERVDERSGAGVTAEQLRNLTDLLGAATLSIASLPDGTADAATRMIADSLGQTRHGPTIYSSIAEDPEADALVATYRFLLKPGWRVPRHPSLFAYLQPEHVQDPRYPTPDDGPVARGDSGPAASADLRGYFATAEQVPLWVASSQRFVEAGWAGEQLRGAPIQPGFEVKRAYDRGAAGALGDIQAMMARHLGDER